MVWNFFWLRLRISLSGVRSAYLTDTLTLKKAKSHISRDIQTIEWAENFARRVPSATDVRTKWLAPTKHRVLFFFFGCGDLYAPINYFLKRFISHSGILDTFIAMNNHFLNKPQWRTNKLLRQILLRSMRMFLKDIFQSLPIIIDVTSLDLYQQKIKKK